MDINAAAGMLSWQWRYDETRVALRDVERLLNVRTRLAAVGGPAPVPVSIIAGGDMLSRAARVGMFAGSFNPLSVAHGAMIEAARLAQRLESVVWAFARVTVDKESVERASLVDRVVQIESCLRSEGSADALAVLGAGLYADQAEALRPLLARDAELWLVMGFDKIVQIFDPRYYADREAALQRLFDTASVLVGPRAGREQRDLDALLDRRENRPYAHRVRYLPLQSDLAGISSSEGRALQARGAPSTEELRTLLAPEGAALAQETEAYATPHRLDGGDPLDRYWLRQAWLAALADTPAVERLHVPLPDLIALGSRDDATGVMVRRWLRGERWDGAAGSVRELLARYEP